MCQSYEGIVEVRSFDRVAGVGGAEDVVNELLSQKEWVLLDERIVEHVDKHGSYVSVVYVVGRKEEKEE